MYCEAGVIAAYWTAVDTYRGHAAISSICPLLQVKRTELLASHHALPGCIPVAVFCLHPSARIHLE